MSHNHNTNNRMLLNQVIVQDLILGLIWPQPEKKHQAEFFRRNPLVKMNVTTRGPRINGDIILL